MDQMIIYRGVQIITHYLHKLVYKAIPWRGLAPPIHHLVLVISFLYIIAIIERHMAYEILLVCFSLTGYDQAIIWQIAFS